MNETIEVLRNKFMKWKDVFESKGLKVNLWNTKVMVSSGITKGGMFKSKVDLRGVCGLGVKANPILCLHCGKGIHCR